METAETMTHLPQFLIGLAMIVAIVGLSWWVASASVKKKWNRYALGEAEATKIRDLIMATHSAFKGKYMPPALRELLTEAWADYRSLAPQAHSLASDEELLVLTNEVNDVLEKIRKQALVEATADDWEADKLALDQELVELQAKHQQSLERLENQLKEKKAHIAERRKQLDEQWVIALGLNSAVAIVNAVGPCDWDEDQNLVVQSFSNALAGVTFVEHRD